MKRSSFFLAVLFLFHFSAVAQTTEGRPGIRIETYATANDGTRLDWKAYTPVGRGPWPAVLVVHGGRFVSGDFDESGAFLCAQALADAGYIAFSINYRLAPPGSLPGQRSSGRFPDQYDDVTLAVLAARGDQRCNGVVGAVGGSAGATHMAWVASHGRRGFDRIDAGVGLSGAYDFSDFSPDQFLTLFIETVTNYVGVLPTDLPALREASPAWNLDRSVSPLFLLDTAGDLMPADQLDDMVRQLKQAGANSFEATTLAGDLHSFAYWPQAGPAVLAFLKANLADGRMLAPGPSR